MHDQRPEEGPPPPETYNAKRRKKSFNERAENIARAINLEGSIYPIKWPYLYRTVEFERGAPVAFEELPQQELVLSAGDDLPNRIVAWARLQSMADELLLVRDARHIADMWRAIAKPIPLKDIASVRWLGETGYTWRRLPWELRPGPSPTWDAMLAKMTNAQAFRHWLGSLFFDQAQQHQYVWMYGEGNDGKGSINRFLAKVFGRSYRSKQPPAPNDKFWTYGLIGARLVAFPDCNAQGFTSSGLFKSLSGGDPIDVEAKGKMSFTAKLNAKFLFLSNENPNISSEKADMRRIIYCEFLAGGVEDPEFEDKLWAEGGSFLSTCVHEYFVTHPRHTRIESDGEGIGEIVSTNEEGFEQLFAEKFKQPNELYCTHAGLAGLTADQLELVTIRPETMLAILREAFKERREQQQFRAWLRRKYGVRKASIRVENGELVTKRYVGACLLRMGLKLSSPGHSVYNSRPN